MGTPTFSFSSESNEHYTPHHVIACALRVLHDIDLDPASCDVANRVVMANRYFTIEDDGLKQDWDAQTVWCNPPYGKRKNKSMAGLFLEKMICEFDRGMFSEGIMLVNAAVSSTWFEPAYRFPICFTSERLQFLGADLKPLKQPTKDNALIYFGEDFRKFAAVFNEIGTVMVRYP